MLEGHSIPRGMARGISGDDRENGVGNLDLCPGRTAKRYSSRSNKFEGRVKEECSPATSHIWWGNDSIVVREDVVQSNVNQKGRGLNLLNAKKIRDLFKGF